MLRFEMVGLRYDRTAYTPSSRARRGSAGRRDSAARALSRREPLPEVLHDISFHLQPGAFRWLLGPSGAGKSSMLRLMYLAVRPTRGRLNLLGTEVTTASRSALPVLRRRIGVVFQDFRLLQHL